MKITAKRLKEVIREEVIKEQSSPAQLYKMLGLPQYLGNAAIGTAMFRNGRFIQDFTAVEVLSNEFINALDKVKGKNIKALQQAAKRWNKETGKTIIAAVVSPSFCSPGSHSDCKQGRCVQSEAFGSKSKCKEESGGRGVTRPDGAGFIVFYSCDGLESSTPIGSVTQVKLTFDKRIGFALASTKSFNWLRMMSVLKKMQFDHAQSKQKKSSDKMAKLSYRYSPYGKAEAACRKSGAEEGVNAPVIIMDSDDRSGFGDDRSWHFNCLGSGEVKLIKMVGGVKSAKFQYGQRECSQRDKKCTSVKKS